MDISAGQPIGQANPELSAYDLERVRLKGPSSPPRKTTGLSGLTSYTGEGDVSRHVGVARSQLHGEAGGSKPANEKQTEREIVDRLPETCDEMQRLENSYGTVHRLG